MHRLIKHLFEVGPGNLIISLFFFSIFHADLKQLHLCRDTKRHPL